MPLSEQTPDSQESVSTKKTDVKKEIIEWIRALAISFLVVLFVTQVLIVNAQVPTGSMISTINEGDRVIGLRTAYWFSSPKRGDIIIFRFPDDESKLFVKRVIGMPGDTVDIIDGKIYINGSSTPLDEPYLNEPPIIQTLPTYHVPEGSYFVLGDNRNYSKDSRYWNNPFVSEKKIIGKAWVRLWPFPPEKLS